MNELSIVIPAYNEENGIAQIIERTLAIRPLLVAAGVEEMELIVVDDGSVDRTAEISAQYQQVKLVRHSKNRGYGAALKTGFNRARGNLLGFLDADGTYPPEHFPHLCAAALQGADLVIGTRMAGADSEMPLVRRVGNLLFASLVSLLGNRRVSDSASGMRVIRREVLARLYPLPDGLNFTPVMTTRALHEGIDMREIPIPYRERVGRSKLSVVRDGMRFLQTIIWTVLTYNPVRVLGGIGVGLGGIAALIMGAIVVMRLMGINRLGAWGMLSLFLATLCAVSGVTLFALGVTFNYLVSLFHRRLVRRGFLGRPLFKKPLERHFWWMGLAALGVGSAVGVVSLWFAFNGLPVERLWFYMLNAAMALLVGEELIVFWIIVQILNELSRREAWIADDLDARPHKRYTERP